jgi:molybdopterin synthase sulfur carrier subunit
MVVLMARVTVRGYASFREVLGREDIEIVTDAETVRQLVDYLAEKYNRCFASALLDSASGEVMKGNKVLVNGRDIDFLQGLATRLKDGDRVVLLTPIGGGLYDANP